MNRFSYRSLSAMFVAIAFTFSFGALASEVSIKKQSDAKSTFAKASKTNSTNPWHFSNFMMILQTVFLFLTIYGRAQNGMAKNLQKTVCTQ